MSATCFVTNGFPLLDSWILRRPSSVADSDPVKLKKSVWHSKDVARIEAEIFRLCKDDCGIPKHHYSAPLRDSYSIPSLTRYSCITGMSLENLVLPGLREPWIHMTRSGAGGLFNARIPLELCVTIGHSMLGAHQFLYVASRPLANASL